MNKDEFERKLNQLTPTQREYLEDFLKGLSDAKIAERQRCTQENVRRHISNLCHHFERTSIDRKGYSCRSELIELFVENRPEMVTPRLHKGDWILPTPEFPEGAVPLDSRFYVNRQSVNHQSIEDQCYEAVMQSGALIRIKAPNLMGKTSLMNRILDNAEQNGCKTVQLNLQEPTTSLLQNLDQFLQWFCRRVDRQLQLKSQMEHYWNSSLMGSTSNCTDYFEECILPQAERGLVVGIDEVDQLFPYRDVAQDVFGMLRSWHEKGKNIALWKRLRLVMVHSTEVYVPLNINQSPFNVGIPIEPSDFLPHQIEHLAKLHGLPWKVCERKEQSLQGNPYASPSRNIQVLDPPEIVQLRTLERQLFHMIGGHPYLVRLAMYAISQQEVTLEQVLYEATTDAGIYQHHLRGLLETLQSDERLVEAFRQVVMSSDPVPLDPMKTYRLHSLGLVKRDRNQVRPRYALYREYFRHVLSR